MDGDVMAVMWLVVTCVASGAWIGWFAGRRYERSKAALHRMRKRRPVVVNISVDVDGAFILRALQNSGYEVVKVEKVMH